ncbi:MAG: hypothetical protein ABL931_05145 [Usitatibacteraceae bacterium]
MQQEEKLIATAYITTPRLVGIAYRTEPFQRNPVVLCHSDNLDRDYARHFIPI